LFIKTRAFRTTAQHGDLDRLIGQRLWARRLGVAGPTADPTFGWRGTYLA